MFEFVKEATKELNEQKLLAAQLHIQNNLDGNLSLASVARSVGASASYFHRLFKARLGETIKAYTDRLRVEKSLYDLIISDLNLLQISLRYGFKNPETYSRVFRRYLGQPPSFFLKQRTARRSSLASNPEQHPSLEVGLRCCEESNFAVTRLTGIHLAFIRHIGPYERVPLIALDGRTLWRELEEFVEKNMHAAKPFVYIGIPQDSPNTTESEKLRFDCCLVVDKPFQSKGQVGYQKIGEGYYGVLTHAGPYSTLSEAYLKLFQLANSLKRFEVAPSFVFELLLNISATSIDDHTWTELYLPLKSKGTLT